MFLGRHADARLSLARSHNPFSQNVWENNDDDAPPAPNGDAGAAGARARLADLFRPPYDLMTHASWDAASVGKLRLPPVRQGRPAGVAVHPVLSIGGQTREPGQLPSRGHRGSADG